MGQRKLESQYGELYTLRARLRKSIDTFLDDKAAGRESAPEVMKILYGKNPDDNSDDAFRDEVNARIRKIEKLLGAYLYK